MSIYRTSVQVVMYVGVPDDVFRFLQDHFEEPGLNIDKPLDEFIEAVENQGDEVLDEIFDNAANLGIDAIVAYPL